MLAASVSVGFVVGLHLAGHTLTLVAALHVGSKMLQATLDALFGAPHVRAPAELADFLLSFNNFCMV